MARCSWGHNNITIALIERYKRKYFGRGTVSSWFCLDGIHCCRRGPVRSPEWLYDRYQYDIIQVLRGNTAVVVKNCFNLHRPGAKRLLFKATKTQSKILITTSQAVPCINSIGSIPARAVAPLDIALSICHTKCNGQNGYIYPYDFG